MTTVYLCNIDTQCALQTGTNVLYNIIIMHLLVIIKNNKRCMVHLLKQLNVNFYRCRKVRQKYQRGSVASVQLAISTR
jgi:hypothetical protein